MNTYFSLLRGINVSGQRKVPMSELRKLYEELRLRAVATYLQSGNVVFQSEGQEPEELQEAIEAAIEAKFGFPVAVLVREAQDLRRVVESNPFIKEGGFDPAFLHVTFLFKKPEGEMMKNMQAPEGETDRLAFGEKEIYLSTPNGYGRTKLSNAFFERKLKVPATTRNWKTVLALEEMGREIL